MIFDRDILKEILDYLNDNLSEMIETINTERKEQTPLPVTIGTGFRKNMFPELLIDFTESNFEKEGLNGELENITETINCEITIWIKDNTNNLVYYVENYIEAIARLMQNYNSDNISYIDLIKIERGELQTIENQTTKNAKMHFEIKLY